MYLFFGLIWKRELPKEGDHENIPINSEDISRKTVNTHLKMVYDKEKRDR